MSSSDIEDIPTATESDQHIKTSLGLATIRILLGIAVGCGIISGLFCFWALLRDEGGPAIGAFLFQLFQVAALLVIGYFALVKKVEFIPRS